MNQETKDALDVVRALGGGGYLFPDLPSLKRAIAAIRAAELIQIKRKRFKVPGHPGVSGQPKVKVKGWHKSHGVFLIASWSGDLSNWAIARSSGSVAGQARRWKGTLGEIKDMVAKTTNRPGRKPPEAIFLYGGYEWASSLKALLACNTSPEGQYKAFASKWKIKVWERGEI